MMRRTTVVIAVMCAVDTARRCPGQRPESRRSRICCRTIATYIQSFIDSFSNVVAEENYQQQITSPRRKRQLKSDLMLVKFPGADGWLVFRDTFEVDGKSVRSEPERLTKLFVEPPESALRRAREITSASEKYNLASIGTMNNPLLVLAMLQAENQSRFRFTLGNIEKSLGPDIRVLQFQEFQTPTLIKVNGNADVFINGLVWVEQATGRVVKTQFNIGKRGTGIEIVDHVPHRSRLADRRAGAVEGVVSGRSGRRHHRRGDLQPLPPLPGDDAGRCQEVTMPMYGRCR